jgi:2-dehydro-3-deoxygalactonokinase
MLHCAGAGFEPVLRTNLARLGGPGTAPVLICGMAGARQGWLEAPYLETPARLDALHEGAIRVPVRGEVLILPGIAQADRRRPDVMRGEETQLLGGTEPDFTGLVCIPGTHSKWVSMEGGQVVRFSTYMTGELFAVLSAHSILAHALEPAHGVPAESPAFRAGVRDAIEEPADLTAALFRVRAAQLLGFEQRSEGAARLSGLLIGMEIAAAVRQAGGEAPAVRLIAADKLKALYACALREAGLRVTVADAENASRQGLFKAATHLWGR